MSLNDEAAAAMMSREIKEIHQEKAEAGIRIRWCFAAGRISQRFSGRQFPVSELDNLWAGDYFEGALALRGVLESCDHFRMVSFVMGTRAASVWINNKMPGLQYGILCCRYEEDENAKYKKNELKNVNSRSTEGISH